MWVFDSAELIPLVKRRLIHMRAEKSVRSICAVLLGGCMVFSLSGCGAKTYRVNYNNAKAFFQGTEDMYRAGTDVTLYYNVIATDKDYSFYLDGEYLNVSYSDKEGYIIQFTMPEHDVNLEVKMRNSMTAEVQEYHVDHISDVFSWIGKTTEELGISKEYFTEGSDITFEGDLFGNAVVGGTVYLLNDHENGTAAVDRIYLSCGSLSFEDAVSELTKRYGRPYEAGEEAYAAVNGGAVAWQWFYTGEAAIKLSQASEQTGVTFDVTSSTAPEGYGWDLNGINENTWHNLSFDDYGFENVTCRHDTYTGCDIYGISYLYQGNSYEVDIISDSAEVPELYLRYDAIPNNAEVISDGAELKLSDDGSGAILWHAYHDSDIWIVYMNENAAEDALLQMKTLLQSAWQDEE